jgi:predicted PurR-regulated permease PerM
VVDVNPSWRPLLPWLAPILLLLSCLVLLRGILLPFLVGMAAAYMLDPAADRLQRLGLGRTAATLLLTTALFAALVPVLLLVLPVIIDQATRLAARCRATWMACTAEPCAWPSSSTGRIWSTSCPSGAWSDASRPSSWASSAARSATCCSPAWPCSTWSRCSSSPPS